jgi:hypothetical protein
MHFTYLLVTFVILQKKLISFRKVPRVIFLPWAPKIPGPALNTEANEKGWSLLWRNMWSSEFMEALFG